MRWYFTIAAVQTCMDFDPFLLTYLPQILSMLITINSSNSSYSLYLSHFIERNITVVYILAISIVKVFIDTYFINIQMAVVCESLWMVMLVAFATF